MTVVADITVAELRRRVAARVTHGQAATESAALDARLLVAHVLGRDPANLILADRDRVGADIEAKALALADRRAAGEPVARIVGRKEFWGLDLLLSPDTLVPRPDTETVVSAALAFIDRTVGRDARLSLLDIGTGSGAILLALLSELPNCIGIGTDTAPGALETARHNARRLGLEGRAHFAMSNWAEEIEGRFDIIVSNPPYIQSHVIGGLPVEVRAHDPHLALDGGPDGLRAYRDIVRGLGGALAAGGAAFLEVGAGQAGPVARIAAEAGFRMAVHQDLAGIERVVELAANR